MSPVHYYTIIGCTEGLVVCTHVHPCFDPLATVVSRLTFLSLIQYRNSYNVLSIRPRQTGCFPNFSALNFSIFGYANKIDEIETCNSLQLC
jgi:hypothetical protein